MTETPDATGQARTGSITVTSATAIGVGGMMGAGLYTLVGLASTTAGVWVPLAFLVGGAWRCSACTPTPSWVRGTRAAAAPPSS